MIAFENVCVTVQGHVWMWRPGLNIRYFPTLLSTLIKNILFLRFKYNPSFETGSLTQPTAH